MLLRKQFTRSRWHQPAWVSIWMCILSVVTCELRIVVAQTQSAPTNEPSASELIVTTDEMKDLAAEAESSRQSAAPVANTGIQQGLNFLALLVQGGVMMIPIGLMSLLVVAMSLERWFQMRTAKLLPRRLRRGIEHFAEQRYSIDPQEIHQLSVRFPSVTSRVLDSLLQKIGRPVPEMNASIADCCQRETDRLYYNVRWLTLAASVTPLIGLLGTVWGMIIAFYHTTQLGPGKNKAEFLAEGIYVALVTTLGGLAVAIPAAIIAHYFEGRITKQISRIEELVLRLVPRFERFEGRTRFDLEVTGLVQRSVAPEAPPVATDSTLSGSHVMHAAKQPTTAARPFLNK